MDQRKKRLGYLMAFSTILIWGTTFICSKLLLAYYTPLQIMLVRFSLAYVLLWILRPKRLKLTRREEFFFLLMGLFSCSVYFFAENSALKYTLVSNVSIIVSAAPIFTAILAHFVTDEKFTRNTLYGFLVAFAGVVLVVFNGAFVLKLSPRGDLLAIAAAGSWAIYSVIMKRFVGKYDAILLSRRMFFWGIVTALPMLMLEGAPFPVEPLSSPGVVMNFLFLGLLASGVCYILWNTSFDLIGVVSTNNFIYINPFVSIVAAAICLHEVISPTAIVGAVLITLGVIVSGRRPSPKKKAPDSETGAPEPAPAEAAAPEAGGRQKEP